jgi:hypothetical protein
VTVYLASPNTQQQAQAVAGMPVLLSFASWAPWLERYQQSFRRVLIDSGAFSELNSGVQVDLDAYSDWAQQWTGHADAVAGLDDISGNWRRSLKNYERCGFPTMHDTDPPELLEELVPIARARGNWLGIGVRPPREGAEDWIRAMLARVPEDLHVHGWALRAFANVRRLDSVDSTNWWRDAMAYRQEMPWLTYGETLEIVVKRYEREPRMRRCREPESRQQLLPRSSS